MYVFMHCLCFFVFFSPASSYCKSNRSENQPRDLYRVLLSLSTNRECSVELTAA